MKTPPPTTQLSDEDKDRIVDFCLKFGEMLHDKKEWDG